MTTPGSQTRSGPGGGEVARSGNGAAPLALALPDELIEAIAERAAKIVADRQVAPEDGWLRGADRIAAYIDSPRSRV